MPISIAKLTNERQSTWFNGYDNKYYYDSGVLLAATGLKCIYIRAAKSALKMAKAHNMSFIQIFKCYVRGIIDYKLKRRD